MPEDDSHVYRHPAKLVDNPLTKVSAKTWHDYGTNSIYTDENNKVYLYLKPKGSEDHKDQWADITVGSETRHYYGYTAFDDETHKSTESALKLNGGKVNFKEPSDAHYGEDFELELDDGSEAIKNASWTFSATGAASIKTVEKNVSPGVKLTLHGNAVGSYTVTGTSNTSNDPEIYWNSEATFTGTTQRGTPEISIVEDPSKEYDRTSVANPAVSTNSAGEITYAYYDKDKNPLDSAPKDAGTYTIVATVAETNLYEKGSSSPYEFTITPRTTVCALEYNSAEAVFTATVYGLVDANGTVQFSYHPTDDSTVKTTESQLVTKLENGEYGARFEAGDLVASDYTVQAIYTPGDSNYTPSESAAETVHTDYSNREISDTRDTQNKFQYVMTYGDDPLQLTLTPDHPTSNDQWCWGNVVSDIHDGVFGDQRTVSIVNGTVSINHVGQTVFDVSLTDGSGVYNTAHHDMEVAVLPKNLYITTRSAWKVYDGKGKGKKLTADGLYEGLANEETVVFDMTGEQENAGLRVNTYRIDWEHSSAKQANYNSVDCLGTLTVVPAPTTMNLTLSQENASPTATATIKGFYDETGTVGTVTFKVLNEDGTLYDTIGPIDVVETNGTCEVPQRLNSVPTGNYQVTATFNPTTDSHDQSNYCPSEATIHATKRTPRDIDPDAELIYHKIYGDNPFGLNLSLTAASNNDTWSYSVVGKYGTTSNDYFTPAGDVVNVDNNNNVIVEDDKISIGGTGMAIIRVNVHDGSNEYEDVTAHVVVHVDSAPYLRAFGTAEKVYDGTQLTGGHMLARIFPDATYEVITNMTVEQITEEVKTALENATFNQEQEYPYYLEYDETASFSPSDPAINAGSKTCDYTLITTGSMKNYNTIANAGWLTIWPAYTTVDLQLSKDGTSATATIKGLNGEKGPNDDEVGSVGTVTFTVNGTIKATKDVFENNGEYVVSTTFDSVPEGATVTATFTPSGDATDDMYSLAHNYLSSTAQVVVHSAGCRPQGVRAAHDQRHADVPKDLR